MAHRKTTPLCIHCHTKRVRRHGYFCTVKCAAEDGQDLRMAEARSWCEACGNWHDPIEAEFCARDRQEEASGD